MRFMVFVSGLDEEDEKRGFDTETEAIAWAKSWFIEGYNNDTIDDETRAAVKEDAEKLEQDLLAGREFYCSRFYECVRMERQPHPATRQVLGKE